MTVPHTLREMAHLPTTSGALASSALVMVDAQNTYRSGIMELAGIEAALDACARLLARARKLRVPIFHIQHDSGPGSPFDITASIGAIADKVAPTNDEPIIVKRYPNSFVGTDLQAHLKASARQTIVVAGFMTHMCVNSTVRGAFNLGYAVTVAADSTATRALPSVGGGTINADVVQSVALAALADVFAVVVPGVESIPD